MKNFMQLKSKPKTNGIKSKANGKPQQKMVKAANQLPPKAATKNASPKKLGLKKSFIPTKVDTDDEESENEEDDVEEEENESTDEEAESEEDGSEEDGSEEDEYEEDESMSSEENERSGTGFSSWYRLTATDLIAFEAEEVEEEESSGSNEEAESSDEEPAEEPISKDDNFKEILQKSKITDSSVVKKIKEGKIDAGGLTPPMPKPIKTVENIKMEYEIETNIDHKSIADELAVYVKNLPLNVSLSTIAEVFGRYGRITAFCGFRGSGIVAFDTPESAIAALDANNKITIKDKLLSVVPKMAPSKKITAEERQKEKESKKANTVYVTHLRYGTTADQIREHFENCGKIEEICLKKKNSVVFAFITFSTEDEAKAAKGLHNTILNKNAISVCMRDEESTRDPKLTIALINKDQLESCSEEKIRSIFEACGEIKSIRMICKKHILAFIGFVNEQAAAKARKLSGTTVGDMQIEIEPLKVANSKTTVFVQNVKPGTTEKEVRQLFSTTGEIENVIVKSNFAIVKFVNSESFCKSFLLNETFLHGQMIFLEPYSEKKVETLKRNRSSHKRPMKSNFNYATPKKARFNN